MNNLNDYESLKNEIKEIWRSIQEETKRIIESAEGDRKNKIDSLIEVSKDREGDIESLVLEIGSGQWDNDSVQDVINMWLTYFWEDNYNLICDNCNIIIPKEDSICPSCLEESFSPRPIIDYFEVNKEK